MYIYCDSRQWPQIVPQPAPWPPSSPLASVATPPAHHRLSTAYIHNQKVKNDDLSSELGCGQLLHHMHILQAFHVML